MKKLNFDILFDKANMTSFFYKITGNLDKDYENNIYTYIPRHFYVYFSKPF